MQAVKRWTDFLDTSGSGFKMGDCYQNAAEFQMEKPEFEGSTVWLCHGEVMHSEKHFYHGHAWLEWGDCAGLVIDPSTGKPEALFVPAPMYYKLGKINPETIKRFTVDETRENLVKTECWGPWEDQND